MNRFIQKLKKLLFPPWWIIVLSVPASAAGLWYAFTESRQETAIAYVVYVLSACSLTWVCAWAGCRARYVRQDINAVMEHIPLLKRYLTDVSFNMSASLYLSLAVNIFYAAMKMGFGIYYHSLWFGTLAVYYFMLAVIHFLLLRHAVKNEFGTNQLSEWKRYRLCGILLLVMNAALTAITALVVLKNESFRYEGYLIYIMAMYAFYSVAMAVRNVIKYRRYHSPVMSAAKALRLAAALVSMLALETAMLTQFGAENTAQFRVIMTGCTGGGVCTMVLAMAVFMICRSTKRIRCLKKEKIV